MDEIVGTRSGVTSATHTQPADDNAEAAVAENGDPRVQALMDAAFRVIRRRIDSEGPTRAGLLPMSWLKPEDIAQRAGVNASIFDELIDAEHTPEGSSLTPFESFIFSTFGTYRGPVINDETVAAMVEHRDDADELVRTGPSNQRLSESDWLDFSMALAVSAYSGHERADYVTFWDEVTNAYKHGLYPLGRQMRPPMTHLDLAVALATVFEGPWYRRMYGVPEPNRTVRFRIDPDSEEREWTIDGIAAVGIMRVLTEAIEPDAIRHGDPASNDPASDDPAGEGMDRHRGPGS